MRPFRFSPTRVLLSTTIALILCATSAAESQIVRGHRVAPSTLPLPSHPSRSLAAADTSIDPWENDKWRGGFGQPGPEGIVLALARGDSDLYLGGLFSSISGLPFNGVARWDGTRYRPLGEGYWAGVDGVVYAILVDGDDVYVGGQFSMAGGVKARNIARYDRRTNTWSTLAQGIGGIRSSTVLCMEMIDGQLYVGGRFVVAGSTVAVNIARWDGSRWHRVGTGANNHVNDLAAHAGKLYAGGDFTIAGDVTVGKVAWYDPADDSWHDMGAAIAQTYQTVMAIEADDEYVYIGGRFDSVAGKAVNHLARYHRESNVWSPLGGGVLNVNKTVGLAGAMAPNGVGPIRIRSMELRGSDLFVGGDFDSIVHTSATISRGKTPADMAIWRTGSEEWSTLPRTSAISGFSYQTSGVYRIAPEPVTHDIYAVADQSTVVYAFVAGAGDEIYIGGDFDFAGPKNLSGLAGDPESVYAPNLARLSEKDTLWSALGAAGPDSTIYALIKDDRHLYAGGSFLRAGEHVVRGIARLDFTTGRWESLGGGLNLRRDLPGPIDILPGFVHDMARDGNSLYVAGQFNEAGDLVTGALARWNIGAERWERVGDRNLEVVSDMVVEGGRLYVIGAFPGDARMGLHIWDGVAWESVAIDARGATPDLRAIAVIGDDVYIAGLFDSVAGLSAANIASWNRRSGQWSTLTQGVGTGVNDRVWELAAIDGRLYVGGEFVVVANMFIPMAAVWDPSNRTWSAVGAGFNASPDNIVTSFHQAKYGIYVGGSFISYGNGASTNRASSITLWDGEAWRTLGNGVIAQEGQPYVHAMVSDDSTLYIGGSFQSAGAKRAQNYAQWTFPRTLEGRTSDVEAPPVASIAEAPSAASSGSAAAVPGDEHWDERFSPQNLPAGASDEVFAMVSDEADLFVGGAFENVVGIPANGVARWDGIDWAPLDDGMRVGVDGYVYALALAGDDLYVGGQFTSAGGVPANNIAVWNRATRRWRALDAGVTDTSAIPFVSAITISNGVVYVGGRFSHAGSSAARSVARWDGTTWQPMGEGIDGNVIDIESFNGRIYVGGSFGNAGGLTANNLAYWEGEQWHAMGDGVVGAVNTLERESGTLLIGGDFTFRECINPPACTQVRTTTDLVGWRQPAGNPTGSFIAYVNDGNWSKEIRDILVVGNATYYAGSFLYRPVPGMTQLGVPTLIKNVAVRVNGYWSHIEEGTDAPSNTLSPFRGRVIAGGAFSQARSVRADNIAEWNPLYRRWRPLSSGFTLGLVSALTSQDGNIYAAGPFRYKDDPFQILDEDNHLALLGTHGWHVQKGLIKGFAVTAASTGEELLVGGSFITADDIIGVNIFRWNPVTKIWRALTPGSGVADQLDLTFVSAITSTPTTYYVGGIFGVVDTFETPNVTAYDRATEVWRALGDGLDKQVWALLVAPDGTLYAGGDFRHSGTRPMSGVARWDGQAWHPLGDGVEGSVRSLAWGNGRLYVGGIFTNAGGVVTDNIAAWNPDTEEWSALGDGLGTDFLPSVDVLAVTRGTLFAGGFFQNSGSLELSNVARWDGERWNALGSGVDHAVYAMIAQDEDIYVAGGFRTAGRKGSPNVGLWHDPTLSIAPADPVAVGSRLLAGPSPFADEVRVGYTIPRRCDVRITVHDLRGVEIARLLDERIDAGEHESVWAPGEEIPAGAYVCRMECDGVVVSRMIVRW